MPTSPIYRPLVEDVQAGATSIGRTVDIFCASTSREIDAAFARIVEKRIEALVLTPGPLFNNNRVQLATLAARHALPAIYSSREFAEAGGLMSYGPSITEEFRQTGIYCGRVLKGEKPADLPVMRATKFEFIINLQTARAFGLEVPPTLLASADEVIEELRRPFSGASCCTCSGLELALLRHSIMRPNVRSRWKLT
jgi:putative ABC transport system substrate-binding protein